MCFPQLRLWLNREATAGVQRVSFDFIFAFFLVNLWNFKIQIYVNLFNLINTIINVVNYSKSISKYKIIILNIKINSHHNLIYKILQVN